MSKKKNKEVSYVSAEDWLAPLKEASLIGEYELKYPNKHGNHARFTGIDGGYYDQNDGRYKLKDGTPADIDRTFPKYIENGTVWRRVIDHLLGDEWGVCTDPPQTPPKNT